MEIKPVILILLDISGYTHFIRTHKDSQLHAEEIIFDLLETVMEQAEHPMLLNKLEGDAAFLFCPTPAGQETAVAQDVVQQVRRFFRLFHQRTRQIATERAECACNACQHVLDLRLKAILHAGQAYFRHILRFEELAGEDVILVHRLLKNHIPAQEYLAMTPAFTALAAPLPFPISETRQERYDDLGRVDVQVGFPWQSPV
jgi:hypothetical protein